MTKKHPGKLTNNISIMLYLHLFLNFINKNYIEGECPRAERHGDNCGGVGNRLGEGGGGVMPEGVVVLIPLRYSEPLSNHFRKENPSLWNPLMTSRRVG